MKYGGVMCALKMVKFCIGSFLIWFWVFEDFFLNFLVDFIWNVYLCSFMNVYRMRVCNIYSLLQNKAFFDTIRRLSIFFWMNIFSWTQLGCFAKKNCTRYIKKLYKSGTFERKISHILTVVPATPYNIYEKVKTSQFLKYNMNMVRIIIQTISNKIYKKIKQKKNVFLLFISERIKTRKIKQFLINEGTNANHETKFYKWQFTKKYEY